MKCKKCVEATDGGLKTNEGWAKPTKHAPTTCIHKNNNKSRENNNVNNDRCDIFAHDAEIDAEQKRGRSENNNE